METDHLNTLKKGESQFLTPNFVKLNDEMHGGKQFGNYCKPCDVIISQVLWEKHLDDVHVISNSENEANCTHCNLVIFGGIADLDQLFIHHLKKHFQTQNEHNYSVTENSDCLDCDIQQISKVEGDNQQGEFENDLQSNLVVDNIEISSEFTEFNKKMHKGYEKRYFCIPCNVAFYSLEDWSDHFENTSHEDFDDYYCFKKCECCELFLFAKPSILSAYEKYHMHGHDRCTIDQLK